MRTRLVPALLAVVLAAPALLLTVSWAATSPKIDWLLVISTHDPASPFRPDEELVPLKTKGEWTDIQQDLGGWQCRVGPELAADAGEGDYYVSRKLRCADAPKRSFELNAVVMWNEVGGVGFHRPAKVTLYSTPLESKTVELWERRQWALRSP